MNVFRVKTNIFFELRLPYHRCLHTDRRRLVHKTALYDFHCSHGAKMVPFAGYSMPLQYGKVSVSASHQHVRAACGLFDVSHMLQTRLHGPGRIKFFELLTVADVAGLKPDAGCLTLFTNNKGGIIDDLIVSNTSQGYLYIVSNAGRRAEDLALLRGALASYSSANDTVELEERSEDALVALQGPLAAEVLQSVCSADLPSLSFMCSTVCSVAGVEGCRVTRCGYTGEDGFEIAIPNDKAPSVCESLLSASGGHVQLAGLAVRDSLRLEAGLCLYGNDISEDTTPVEAGLTWTVAKRRRQEGGFPGAEIILAQLRDKPSVRRVGLVSTGPPPRPPTEVLGEDGQVVGKVCSGCPSPSLGHNIAMAYVPSSLSKPGTVLSVRVRGKVALATVTKMPFVPTRYYVPAKR